jgi:hypothetical protein
MIYSVIVSEAKQSIAVPIEQRWIASSRSLRARIRATRWLLAMTMRVTML